jgi:4-hydroxy-tetrahydrodipicolinate synthase
MAIEGCGVSAFVVWKDETCSEIDEGETRKHFRRLVGEIKSWGYLVAGGVETEIDTTTRAEKQEIIKLAVEEARGEVPVFCGAHADSLWEQIEMANDGKALGAKGVLFHPPGLYPGFTTPQNEEFIVEHLKRFDEEVGLPIAVYGNPPGGGAQNHNTVRPETYRKAAEQVKNIQAWKIAGGNLNFFHRAHETMKGTQVNTCPAGSSQPQLFITHAMGWAKGALSGGSNFTAKWDMEVMRKAMEGNLEEALALASKLKVIFDVVYGTSPGLEYPGFVERYKLHGWLAGLIPEMHMRYPRLPRPKVEVEMLYQAMIRSGLYDQKVLSEAEKKVKTYDREKLLKVKQKAPILRWP